MDGLKVSLNILYYAPRPPPPQPSPFLYFVQRGVPEVFRGDTVGLPAVPRLSDEGQPEPRPALQRRRVP